MVEVGFAEPALHPRRDRPRLLGGTVGGGQRLGPGGQLLEGGPPDPLPRLDHDDRRPCPGRDRLGEGAEQERARGRAVGDGRRTHDHEIGGLGLAQDRVANRRRLAQDAVGVPARMLLQERAESVLGLGADRARHARRDHVEDFDPGVVPARQGIGELQGQLRVRSAADRDEDPPDLVERALLDHRDVAGRVPHHGVDRGREDRAGAGAPAAGGATAPAEDDEVGVQLPGGLDDALRRPPRRCAPAAGSGSPGGRSPGPSGAGVEPGGPGWRPRTGRRPRGPPRSRARSARRHAGR